MNVRRSTNFRDTPTARREARREGQRRSGSSSQRRENASDRLRASRGRLPPDVADRLREEQAFQVITANRSHWIDPFSGAAVPIPANASDLVRFKADHLLNSDSWRRSTCLDMITLHTLCWRLDLQRLLRHDKRFRLFSSRGGLWMNPYTGDLVDEVQRPDSGSISQETIAGMARHLAQRQTDNQQEPLSPDVLRQAMGVINRDRDDNRSAVFAPVEVSNDELSRDLERATAVQARMMLEPPKLPGFDIARIFRPHGAVSGDAYDMHIDDEGCFQFVLADVAGHGLQGALISAGLLRSVRLLRRNTKNPKELLIALNDELKPELLPGQFVTVCAGRLDPRDNVLQVCLAGHHPCLVLNPNADIILSRFGEPGMVLGVAEGTAFADSLSIEEIVLSAGDTVVQFSDGIFEACGKRGEFGLMRLATRMLRQREMSGSAQRLLDDAVATVEKFCEGQLGDDVTMIAIIADAD